MKIISFFNNKGGVGKTSLVYHLAWMFAERGLKVLAADLDPQANLTGIALSEEALENLFACEPRPTVFTAIAPIKRGVGDLSSVAPIKLASKLRLLLGDLALSEFEDDLSQNWPRCLDRDERLLSQAIRPRRGRPRDGRLRRPLQGASRLAAGAGA